MSRSIRHKEKHESRSQLSQDNFDEGTAARTRPFSFDEIMHRRKNKKQYGDVEAMAGEARNTSAEEIVEKVSARSGSDRVYRNRNDPLSVIVKPSLEDSVKESSRKKEDNTLISEDKFVKRKDKQSREYETKSKATLNKGVGNKAKEGKDDRRSHGRRKNYEWLSGDSENESEKRRARDLVEKGRYVDRSRGKSEKETKRKHRNDVDDDRNREKNAVKKHDSGRRHDSEISVRKERKESSEFHYKESNLKKRRSRSTERDKDKGRRSHSPSPRSHKHTTYNVREYGELASHYSKERSRRLQPDDDRSKISDNGLTSHYRRHAGSTSGLGGYSPRKRKTEAAVKTPSPPHRSPEKKSAAWDLPPAGADSNPTGLVVSNLQSSDQTAPSNTYDLSSVAAVSSTTVRALSGVFSNATIDSIQLTQATRPMRRLYVENLPASASEKAVMECFNNFLLSSGVNHIQGTQPCISCIIHKEKGQALVEFLTAEDASTALSFDGRSFLSSILKVRRPKDYVEMATGVPDKSAAAFDSISDVVRDSPHKIFIGGISKAISSEMLREIASAFGPLKAFHFEVNVDLNERCAFLEYVDQSVTLKACAGLNGMCLGGQMLTVVLATPDASSVDGIGNSSFYGIPEHAKPLLEKPTQVLKLKNVLDPEGLSSLSETELEEILEDIRVECARFGTVKSVNVVKCSDSHSILEKGEASDDTGLNCIENVKTEIAGEHIDNNLQEIGRSECAINANESQEVESEEVDKTIEGEEGICGDTPMADLIEADEKCEPVPSDSRMAFEVLPCKDNSNAISLELDDRLKLKDQMECHDGDKDQLECHDGNKVDDNILRSDADMENKSMVQEKSKSENDNGEVQEASAEMNCGARMDLNAPEKIKNGVQPFDLEDVFEPGCVLVEYRRVEASSVAAHCLHGRLFDERIVSVAYVAYDTYKKMFPK